MQGHRNETTDQFAEVQHQLKDREGTNSWCMCFLWEWMM